MRDKSQICEGGCSCGHVRYRVLSKPMIVHCCHCRQCQRQTGTAFALNALIETDQVQIVQGAVEELTVSTSSGKGQIIARCPECRVAVWSNYHMSGLKTWIRFIRVGTLDNPDLMPPDVHIFTSDKQPWVCLPEGALSVETFYNYDEVWSSENLKRRYALLEGAGIGVP